MESQGLSDMQVEIAQEQDPQPNVHIVVVEVTIFVKAGGTAKKYYVGWRRVGCIWMMHGASLRAKAKTRRD